MAAPVCRDFVKLGYCDMGASCPKQHFFNCPDYTPGDETKLDCGKPTCRLNHPSAPLLTSLKSASADAVDPSQVSGSSMAPASNQTHGPSSSSSSSCCCSSDDDETEEDEDEVSDDRIEDGGADTGDFSSENESDDEDDYMSPVRF